MTSGRGAVLASVAFEPAARFVYALARERAEVMPSIDPARDWPVMLRLATREQALLALRDHCQTHPAILDRPAWGHRLALLALDAQRRMHGTRRRLEETLVALNDAQVTPLLLKGAAMAAVYDAWNRRSMRDIDVLVDPDDVAASCAAATAASWVPDASVPDDVAYQTHHHTPPLVDARGSGLRLEIHRSLLPVGHPFAIEREEIVAEARGIEIGQGRAIVMQPHHHAVHIAIHFAWSHEARVGAWNAFCDLDLLLRRGAINWSRLVETATRWRARSCLYWTLRLARSLSAVPVPTEVLAELSPITSRVMLDRLERHFMKPLLDLDAARLPVRLDRTLWSAALQPRQQGHGASRPWLVSSDLRVARGEPTLDHQSPPLRKLTQLKQSVLYLTSLV